MDLIGSHGTEANPEAIMYGYGPVAKDKLQQAHGKIASMLPSRHYGLKRYFSQSVGGSLTRTHQSMSTTMNRVLDNMEMELDTSEQLFEDIKSMEEIRESAIPMNEKKRMKVQLMTRKQMGQTILSQNEEIMEKVKSTRKSFLGKFRYRFAQNTLWNIESRYGSAVVSYFKFIKWTLVLNVTCLFFVILLILVPEVVEQESENLGTPASCSPEISLWVPEENSTECCTAIYQEDDNFEFDGSDFFPEFFDLLQDLLQGTNWMEYSPMFYGYYSGTFVFDLNGVTFDFPLAYILVMMSVFFISLVSVVFSSARSFKSDVLRSDASSCIFTNILYSSWDHSINKRQGVIIQQKNIEGKFKLSIVNKDHKNKKQGMDRKDMMKLYLVRILINLFVVASLAGTAFGIYQVTVISVPKLLRQGNCSQASTGQELTDLDAFLCLVFEYIPSFIITVANVLLPFVFTNLIVYERYTSGTELTLNLARCIFLRLASLAIAFLSIYFMVRCDYELGCYQPADNTILELPNNSKNCSHVNGANLVLMESCANTDLDSHCEKPICWETFLGQQFYKLTVMDFGVQILLIFFVDLPRVLLFGRFNRTLFCNMVGRIEFNISKHVLDIVYSQTICWLTVFYAPLILLVTIVKSFILFYCRIFYVLFLCTPSSVPFSASRASSLFKYFLLLAFVVVILAVGITLARVQPSLSCGPYRSLNCDNEVCHVYDYITQLLTDGSNETFEEIALFLYQPTVLISVSFVLALTFYFYWASGNAQFKLSEELKSELIELSKDKSVLLLCLKEQEQDLF